MQSACNLRAGIRPTGNRVLLERLDGDGREEQLTSGVWIPARDQSLRHGNAERVPDTFRARVLAVSEGARKATDDGLAEGDEVICHTYEQTNQRTLVGDETPFGLLVDVENILGVYEDNETQRECLARLDRQYDAMSNANANAMSNGREREQAIMSLGYHRRGGF